MRTFLRSLLFVYVLIACLAPNAHAKKKKKLGKKKAPPVEIKGPVIGIDLGTTYSCVGHFKGGNMHIIPNDQGNRITPSYVAFTDEGERLVGDAAKNQATQNPSNTIFDIKRFIGRKFSDKSVQSDKKLLPFTIANKDGKPYVSIKKETSKGSKTVKYSPEEISAMVLQKMKKVAEDYLGEEVFHAVVTVPAYFNDAQRQATKDAGVIAGLNVLRIINEPTAAAIAYGLDQEFENKNILVYDLGGGTFDVTVLTIDGGVFEVLATNGDTHLGGEDFDNRLVKYLMKRAKKLLGGDVSGDKRAMAKLRRAAEHAKRTLSSELSVKVEVESLVEGLDFSDTLSRAKFNDLNEDLFRRTLKPVQKVLKDADLGKGDIHEIVMVGGSTRIPRVQALVQEFFDGKAPNQDVNPDEAVAYGAAIQASVLSGDDDDSTKGLLLLDVTPLTLGIELSGGVYLPFIERNSVIPTKAKHEITTKNDYQTVLPISIFQGERAKARDNVFLGEFKLSGLPPLRKGVVKAMVYFQLDANGILQVTAEDKATKRRGTITITADKGRLSDAEIERMVRNAEKYAEQDELFKDLNTAKNSLENYIYNARSSLSELDVEEEEKAEAKAALTEAERWMEADNGKRNLADYEAKLEDLEGVCGPIIEQAYGSAGGGDDDGDAFGEDDFDEDADAGDFDTSFDDDDLDDFHDEL